MRPRILLRFTIFFAVAVAFAVPFTTFVPSSLIPSSLTGQAWRFAATSEIRSNVQTLVTSA